MHTVPAISHRPRRGRVASTRQTLHFARTHGLLGP